MSFPPSTLSQPKPLSPPPESPPLTAPKRHVALPDSTAKWTSLISPHCRNGHLSEAASKLTRMRLADVEPNHVTFVSLLSACVKFPSKSFSLGPSLHAYVCKLGLDRNNVKVGTAIIGFYSKCGRVDLAMLAFHVILSKNRVSWNTMLNGYMRNGLVEDALKMFDEMPERDAVSFTAIIGGFLKRGEFEEALYWFKQMQNSGIKPDYVTVVSVLSACANLGALGVGLWVHKLVLNMKLGDNVRVNNALVDMYSRCGCVHFASQVFENMIFKTVVSWNSMMIGFAMNGYVKEALKLFKTMLNQGLEPDAVTFTGALAACSHSGLVDEGLNIFTTMKKVYKISPSIEHYGCIVDLYSRAGRLKDALNVILNMPRKPNDVILGSLLAACATHGDVTLAEKLMDYIIKLDPKTDSNYVLLSNIYAGVGSWAGANRVRKKMKDMEIQKKPGISSIEVDCIVHEFVAGDKSHIDTENIYDMLELLHIDIGVDGSPPESY